MALLAWAWAWLTAASICAGELAGRPWIDAQVSCTSIDSYSATFSQELVAGFQA
ncbi:hypothetical protein D3C78_1964440 [compost metagenome]